MTLKCLRQGITNRKTSVVMTSPKKFRGTAGNRLNAIPGTIRHSHYNFNLDLRLMSTLANVEVGAIALLHKLMSIQRKMKREQPVL
jgi:hypothetical protein